MREEIPVPPFLHVEMLKQFTRAIRKIASAMLSAALQLIFATKNFERVVALYFGLCYDKEVESKSQFGGLAENTRLIDI